MLIRDRFVIAALVFVLTQWVAAALAGEQMTNSLKAAVRVSAGLFLFCVVMALREKKAISKVWSISSIVAAAYGLLDFTGLGFPGLFREMDFYFGDQIRLSGSFEYPTTAAAFYAISLPLVFTASIKRPIRVAGCVLLWTALILTYSRGPVLAAGAVLVAGIAISSRQDALKLAAAGVLVYLVLIFFQPLLVARYGTIGSGRYVGAEYRPDFNAIRQKPAVIDTIPVTVRNSGMEKWSAAGEDPVFLSYHWYDTEKQRIVEAPAMETKLPYDMEPYAAVTLSAVFRTPDEPGLYLLDWDLKQGRRGWFSTEHQIVVAVVEARIEEDALPWKGNTDISRWYKGRAVPTLTSVIDATVPRTTLWKTAAALAMQSPLIGWGPDNFRLLYGPKLGVERWDSNIRSNNLYLELLVGSGFVGLVAFIVMMGSLRWTLGAASMGVAVFLIHGLVDVMLMTTPIYFGFWILMGLAHENQT
jgi:hypothetical protein